MLGCAVGFIEDGLKIIELKLAAIQAGRRRKGEGTAELGAGDGDIHIAGLLEVGLALAGLDVEQRARREDLADEHAVVGLRQGGAFGLEHLEPGRR